MGLQPLPPNSKNSHSHNRTGQTETEGRTISADGLRHVQGVQHQFQHGVLQVSPPQVGLLQVRARQVAALQNQKEKRIRKKKETWWEIFSKEMP